MEERGKKTLGLHYSHILEGLQLRLRIAQEIINSNENKNKKATTK